MIYDESVDFSELEKSVWYNNKLEDLQKECRENKLTAGGSRETLIVRLFTENAVKTQDAVLDEGRRSAENAGRRRSLIQSVPRPAGIVAFIQQSGSRTSSIDSLQEPLMPSQQSQPTRVSFDGIDCKVSDVRHGGNDLSVN